MTAIEAATVCTRPNRLMIAKGRESLRLSRSARPRALQGSRCHRQGLLQRRRSGRVTRAWMLKLTDEGEGRPESAAPISRYIDAALLQALPQARRALPPGAAGDREERLEGEGV